MQEKITHPNRFGILSFGLALIFLVSNFCNSVICLDDSFENPPQLSAEPVHTSAAEGRGPVDASRPFHTHEHNEASTWIHSSSALSRMSLQLSVPPSVFLLRPSALPDFVPFPIKKAWVISASKYTSRLRPVVVLQI